MTPSAIRRVAAVLAMNTHYHRESAVRLPILADNAKEAENKNREAAADFGILQEYNASLSL